MNTRAISYLLLALVAFALAILAAVDAHAQEGWVRDVLRHERRVREHEIRRIEEYRRRHAIEARRLTYRNYELRYVAPPAYNWQQMQNQGCLPPYAAVGLEKYSPEEARNHAVAMWMEQIKLHKGVKYMNPKNAIVLSNRGRGPDCYLSATGNRVSERTAESMGGRVLHQCEFIAAPCEGGVEEDER